MIVFKPGDRVVNSDRWYKEGSMSKQKPPVKSSRRVMIVISQDGVLVTIKTQSRHRERWHHSYLMSARPVHRPYDSNQHWGALYPMPFDYSPYIPTDSLSWRRTAAWNKLLQEGTILVQVFKVHHRDGVWPLSRNERDEVLGVFLTDGTYLNRHNMQRRVQRAGYRVCRIRLVVDESKLLGSL